MRRYGEPRVIGQVYTDRPGAYAFVRRGSDVLMTIEDHPRGDAPDIQIPGGGIDPGERSAALGSISAIATCPNMTNGRGRFAMSISRGPCAVTAPR